MALMSVLVAALVLSVVAAAQPWLDASLPPDSRAKHLLKVMSTQEKILLLSGRHSEDKTCGDYIGRVGTDNCGVAMNHSIPTLLLNDAGQGFREENNTMPGSTTQWPSALAMGATWSRDAVTEWGAAMGAEFKGKGANVQLYVDACLRVHAFVRAFVRACVHLCMHLCVHLCVRACVHGQKETFIRTHSLTQRTGPLRQSYPEQRTYIRVFVRGGPRARRRAGRPSRAGHPVPRRDRGGQALG